MADLRLTVTVAKDGITADLQRRMRLMPGAAAAGLYTLGNAVMTSAKRRTPVDTGVLRGSGYVMAPVTSGGQTTCKLGFGGAAKAYALVQHERLDFKHPNGGEAKYLENAIIEFGGSKGTRIFVDAVEKFLASNGGDTGGGTTGGGGGAGHVRTLQSGRKVWVRARGTAGRGRSR